MLFAPRILASLIRFGFRRRADEPNMSRPAVASDGVLIAWAYQVAQLPGRACMLASPCHALSQYLSQNAAFGFRIPRWLLGAKKTADVIHVSRGLWGPTRDSRKGMGPVCAGYLM